MFDDFKKEINNTVWWIPFKQKRNKQRDKLLHIITELERLFYENIYNNNELNLIKKSVENNNNVKLQSLNQQDLLAYIFFNGKKDGFFVDIGAYDGIVISNTYILEKIGWKGVCVEADIDRFKLLQKNRNCDCYNFAVHSKSGEFLDFLTSNNNGLNVLELHATNEHIDRMKKTGNQDELKKYKIETITFDDLMSKNYPDVNYIDFLSIDVEGGELIILETIDFNKYSFGLITVENNFKNGELVDFMKKRGYEVLIDLWVDIMFVKSV